MKTRTHSTITAAALIVGAVLVVSDQAVGQIIFPTPTATATPAPPPDHFTCYRAKTTSDTAKFVPVTGVSLVDQIRASTVDVKRLKFLCAPTNKNGEDPSAPSHPDHLQDYLIKAPSFTPVLNQKVDNQFGTIFVDLKKPLAIQVPTAKDETQDPPEPSNPAVDHFTCYKAKLSTGQSFTRIAGVTLDDQFGGMTVDVIKPTRLCLPTNKNNEEPGADDHTGHLMCYKIKQMNLPKFVTVPGLFTHDQFGPLRVDAKRPSELCVPSLRNFVPATPTPTATATPIAPCGNGVLDLPGEECDPNPNTPPGPPALCDPSQCVSLGATGDDAFACTCADGQARVIYDEGRLDNGWTGTSHNTNTVANTDFDALLFDCDGTLDTACRLTGPRAGKYGSRCELNARIHCTSDTDCAPTNGRCGAFLGAPLPLSSGGVPVCVTSFFPRPVTGTLDVADGSSESNSFLLSRVHLADDIATPCARCNCTAPLCTNQVGDAGTCSGGAAIGQACIIEGTTNFGPVSRDCPPSNAANISGSGLDIRFLPTTTGTSTKTATLPCTAAAFAQYQCPCDTCAGGTTPNAPCASNADCPGGGICGATRCIGGPNDGQTCPPAACGAGNSCGRPGILTQPNNCDLGCQGGDNDGAACSVSSECPGGTCVPLCMQLAGEQTGIGECPLGPTDGHCSAEPFRGCNVDAQCNAPSCIPPGTCPTCVPACGQTCQFNQRPCHVFPMSLQGDANPFVLNDSSGTSVNTFCIPPTTSPAVNSTAGLPGEGAIIVPHNFTKKFPADVCGSTCP